MKNNIKMFFVLVLVTLLVAMATVTASSDADSSVVTDTTTASDVDVVSTSQAQSTSSSVNTLNDKDNKDLKSDSITINGVEYEEVVEYEDIDEGVYDTTVFIDKSSVTGYIEFGDSIYINDTTITGDVYGELDYDETFILNNSQVNSYFEVYGGCLYVYNSTLEGYIGDFDTIEIYNSVINAGISADTIVIDNDSVIGDDFSIYSDDIQTNNSAVIDILAHQGIYIGTQTIDDAELDDYMEVIGDLTIINSVINSEISLEGKLTVKNSTLNARIDNEGTLTIDEDVVFGDDCVIDGQGEIVIDDVNRIAPYLVYLYDEYYLDGVTFSGNKNNNGNISFNNSMVNATINNYGNLTFANSTINGTIYNYGIVTISDDTVLAENFKIEGSGEVVIDDIDRLLPFLSVFNGTYVIENMALNNFRYNYGNLTLINCTVNTSHVAWSWGGVDYYSTDTIYNYGKLELYNCTLIDAAILNYANISLDNSSIPSSGFLGCGNISISNAVYDGVFSSSSFGNNLDYESNAVLRNITVIGATGKLFEVVNYRFNNLNLSMYDCQFINCGNPCGVSATYLTADNCTFINNTIGNTGFLMASELEVTDCLFENNTILRMGGTSGAIIVDNAGVISNCTFNNNRLNISNGGLITVRNSSTITGCRFDNNTMEDDNGARAVFNGVCIRATPSGDNMIVIENNNFTNSRLNGQEGTITSTWYYTYDFHTNAYGTDISIDGDGTNTYVLGSNIEVLIRNNRFINSTTTQKAGAIFVNFNSSSQNNALEITGNTFENVRSQSETIIHNNTDTLLIADNTYNNCTIDVDEFTLTSPVADSVVVAGDDVELAFAVTLLNPEYYDADIIDYYNIIVNDSIVGGTSENTFTYTPVDYGTLNIQASLPELDGLSNEVIVYVNSYELTLNPVTAEIGSTATITVNAMVNDEPMQGGRVYFTFNGKVLRDDATGRILYADIADGVATLSDVNVTKAWNEDSEIKAVFQATSDVPTFTSEAVNPTITYPETGEVEFSVGDVTATAGEEITITLTTKNLDGGKVVLKVNGKTVKADDGKLYTKVEGDTTTFTYTVPKTLKAGEYLIKAVCTSGTTKYGAESLMTIA